MNAVVTREIKLFQNSFISRVTTA